ncbi:hypothetical protein [Mesorhizobium sp. M0578]|uniref:hypothetical protein n=1 Tax=unclassified Mesorhizobium TaxID=325217 RepID=UPI0033388A36
MSTSKPTEGTLDAKLERMLANWEKPAVRSVMLPGTQMTCDEAAAAIRAALTGTVEPVEAVAVKVKELVEKLAGLRVGTEKKYNLTGDMWFFELWHALGEAAAALVAPAPTSAVDGADLITRITSFLSGHLSGPIQSRGNALLEEAVAALSKATLQGEAAVDGEAVKRPSYSAIIDLVNGCVERMKRSGESHLMLAKWISEGLNAALSAQAVPASMGVAGEMVNAAMMLHQRGERII